MATFTGSFLRLWFLNWVSLQLLQLHLDLAVSLKLVDFIDSVLIGFLIVGAKFVRKLLNEGLHDAELFLSVVLKQLDRSFFGAVFGDSLFDQRVDGQRLLNHWHLVRLLLSLAKFRHFI